MVGKAAKGCLVVFLGFIGLSVILQLAFRGGSKPGPTASPTEANSSASVGSNETEAASAWSYSESKDDMRGTTSKFAELESTNSVDFDFPYSGGSKLTIRLQKRGSRAAETALVISKGQFLCHSFSNQKITAKFDTGPIRTFSCTDASDGSSNVAFVLPAGAFISALRRSQKVVVEAEFFQEGRRQFDFDTAKLKW